MNWESHRHTRNFFDTMVSSNLLPRIVQPTRFNESNHTFIDIIYYNEISSECISENLSPHITDHQPNFLWRHLLKTSHIVLIKTKRAYFELELQTNYWQNKSERQDLWAQFFQDKDKFLSRLQYYKRKHPPRWCLMKNRAKWQLWDIWRADFLYFYTIRLEKIKPKIKP